MLTLYTNISLLILFSIILVCVGPTSCGGLPTEWTKEDYPNPMVNVNTCGNNDSSLICDPSRLMSQFEAEKLNRMAVDIYDSGDNQTYRCKCHYSETCAKSQTIISVALVTRIVSRTGSGYPASCDERARLTLEFADFLRSTSWNFGGSCGNDVVIVISQVDRQVRTVVGQYAGKMLTEACIRRVYDRTKHYLTQGEFYVGVQAMINHYSAILSGDASVCDDVTVTALVITFGVMGALLLFIAVTLISCKLCCPKSLAKCHRGSRNHRSTGFVYHGVHEYGWYSGGGCGGYGGGGAF